MPTTGFQVNGSDVSNYFVPKDVFSQGQLWTWGNNQNGGLGDNTITSKSSPVQTIAGGMNWIQASSGERFGGGIKSDGTLWTWGANDFGQLGINDITNRSSPVQTVSGGTNWKQLAAGSTYCVSIKTDGTLWAWGRNDVGQLGDSTTTSKSSPIQTIAGGTNWKQVSVSVDERSTYAIKTDGSLWAWGNNTDGKLGIQVFLNQNVSSPTVVGSDKTWKLVSAGSSFAAAIKTDGTLWTWGGNGAGQLGDNTTTSKSSPIQTIASGTNWKQVAAGAGAIAAIKSDGTLWVWGNNTDGELGTNNTTSYSSPIQTIASGTNWKQVSVGLSFTAAVKTDGTLWTWGLNDFGQLGSNSTTSRSSPAQTVAGQSNWKQVVCDRGQAFALNDIS